MKDDLLPDELLWAEGGHVSDVVLTALADGEHSIVPPKARSHVERCGVCTTHLGHAALLSIHVHSELRAHAEHERRAASPARRPLPRLAIALGLAVAAVGLVPTFFDGGTKSFLSNLPFFLKGLGTVVRKLNAADSTTSLFLTYAAALTLVAMGFAFVRILPKKETSR